MQIKPYTTLGNLKGHELGIDQDGDVMALAPAYVRGEENGHAVCVVIRKSGNFEVYELDAVPMEWQVAKAKMIIVASPVPEEEA